MERRVPETKSKSVGEENEMRDVIFDLAKYAMDNGKRITISISQFDDGGSCVSFTIFEPKEENDG